MLIKNIWKVSDIHRFVAEWRQIMLPQDALNVCDNLVGFLCSLLVWTCHNQMPLVVLRYDIVSLWLVASVLMQNLINTNNLMLKGIIPWYRVIAEIPNGHYFGACLPILATHLLPLVSASLYWMTCVITRCVLTSTCTVIFCIHHSEMLWCKDWKNVDSIYCKRYCPTMCHLANCPPLPHSLWDRKEFRQLIRVHALHLHNHWPHTSWVVSPTELPYCDWLCFQAHLSKKPFHPNTAMWLHKVGQAFKIRDSRRDYYRFLSRVWYVSVVSRHWWA